MTPMGDDRISRDEIPARARSFIDFDTLDTYADGLLHPGRIT